MPKKLLVIVLRPNCNAMLFARSDILDCDNATVCDLLKFSEPPVYTMLSRSARAETRQSRKEDIKRVMHSVDKVIILAETIIIIQMFLYKNYW